MRVGAAAGQQLGGGAAPKDGSRATYRTEVERAVDCGDRVVHLTRDIGVLWETTREVALELACVYTIRDGRIVRWDAYLDRAEALAAVGLEPEGDP